MLQVTSPRRAEDRLKYLAGSEAAMGAWIGDVTPEQAAITIRAAIDRADAADASAPDSATPDRLESMSPRTREVSEHA